MSIERALDKARRKKAFPPPEVRRQLRERAGLTQRDVAEAIEAGRASVARYELGLREPSGEVLARYQALLDRLTVELARGVAA